MSNVLLCPLYFLMLSSVSNFYAAMGRLPERSLAHAMGSTPVCTDFKMPQPNPFGSPKSRETSLQSSSRSTVFLIGKDSRGNWVVRDGAGLRGGLFVDRSDAVRFAMQENGYHSRAVIMVPGTLELMADFWPPLEGRKQERAVNDPRGR
jgi:hypothetical protein